jgi:sugar phosphate isomerase/epimerase
MKVGLQMYSVRESFEADPRGTLEQVAGIGYHAVEFANHRALENPGCGVDISAEKLRGHLSDFGIVPIGAHIAPFVDEVLEGVIAYYSELGSRSVAMSIDFWDSREMVLERCAYYNRVGERCQASGLQFYFHNHYHEFQVIGGERVLDTIVANTDPELVKLELDTYWTFRGAVDPVAKIREYRDRVGMLHQKDFPISEARYLDVWARLNISEPLDREAFESMIRPAEFVEIGDGMMKVQDIIDAGNEAAVSYMLVEQDHGRELTEVERIERSIANLRKMRGLDWQQS